MAILSGRTAVLRQRSLSGSISGDLGHHYLGRQWCLGVVHHVPPILSRYGTGQCLHLPRCLVLCSAAGCWKQWPLDASRRRPRGARRIAAGHVHLLGSLWPGACLPGVCGASLLGLWGGELWRGLRRLVALLRLADQRSRAAGVHRAGLRPRHCGRNFVGHASGATLEPGVLQPLRKRPPRHATLVGVQRSIGTHGGVVFHHLSATLTD
mmetsp:Transcript_77167/g.170392  ORF Transcript_77167/g.170392 Transcript_77167/m.170392 type:complete len:209 (+) Transcript_77167:1091-1717(+)